jgi:hypothetical protein
MAGLQKAIALTPDVASLHVQLGKAMHALAPALQKLAFEGAFPDEAPSRLLRRGIAACGTNAACTFTMLLPGDARPVK